MQKEIYLLVFFDMEQIWRVMVFGLIIFGIMFGVYHGPEIVSEFNTRFEASFGKSLGEIFKPAL